MNPFQNPVIRRAFFAHRNTERSAMAMGILAFEGDGPFGEQDFFDFLLDQGCAAIPLTYWTMEITDHMTREETLRACLKEIYPNRKVEFLDTYNHIVATNSEVSPVFSLKFCDVYARFTKENNIHSYTQEMIMLWLATGVDPYEGDPEALNELLKHPALAIELDPADTITWPSTYAQPANPHHGIAFDAEDHGLLSHFGYHVGKKAPSQARRREAILKALRQPLSNTDFSDTYVLDCGPPNSQQRLQKIINALAAFIRNGKRRGPGHQLAVEHWQQDLDWLEESFG